MDTNLKNKLLFPRKNASAFMTSDEIKAADEYCRPYIAFLNAAKTDIYMAHRAFTAFYERRN